jgi:hypothetical protein
MVTNLGRRFYGEEVGGKREHHSMLRESGIKKKGVLGEIPKTPFYKH